MMTKTIVGLGCLVLAAAAPATAAATQPQAPAHKSAVLNAQTWRPVAERVGYHLVSGVSAPDAGTAFVAGSRASTSLLRNFSGGRWITMPLGNGRYSGLSGVDALDSDDAWAFGGGTHRDHGTGVHTVTNHWDGHRWAEVPSGGVGRSQEMWLDGGAMTSADDVWAVGTLQLGEGYDYRSIIKHWDGTGWSRVPSPLPSEGYNALWAVDGLSADDAWAVGETSEQDLSRPALLHWDGNRWHKSAGAPPDGDLTDIDAVSPDDIWVVGDYFPEDTMRTFAMHWDGRSWTHVTTPNPFRNRHTELLSVDAVGPDDVWAVGDVRTNDAEGPWYMARTVIEHYDGTRWRLVQSPDPGSHYNGLVSVSMSSADDGWAVGLHADGDDPSKTVPLYLHWDGADWRRT